MTTTVAQILQDFPELIQHLAGPKEAEITDVCAHTTIKKGGVIFVHNKEALEAALSSPLQALVVPANWEAPENLGDKTLLASKNVKQAMAQVAEKYFTAKDHLGPFDGENIHPSAVISKTVKLGAGVIVGPSAVIGAGCEIGDNVFIGANATIETRVKIGKDSVIQPNVWIAHDVVLGQRCFIKANASLGGDGFGYATDEKGQHYKVPHRGKLVLGDDVHIGNNSCVDRGTFDDATVGNGTKIDNHCHVGHNNTVGEGCLITAGLISAGSATIGSHSVFAGRVSINGHITLCDQVMLGPLTAVVGDIRKPGAYGGYPAIPLKDSMKVQASLASLPKLRKTVSKLSKKVGLEE